MTQPDANRTHVFPDAPAPRAATRSLRVLVVGEESAGMELVRSLVSGPHQLVGVMTSPGGPPGQMASLWGTAQSLGLPILPAERVKDPAFANEIRAMRVDLLLNVHSLHIVHRECLAAPRLGSFNLHPGPLPQYAGLNCVSWALYQGESRYGVTLHRMAADIDTGALAGQTLFDIEPTDTALTLALKCVKAGLPLIHQLLQSAAETDTIPTREQDLGARRYYGKDVPGQGWLDWTRPAQAVCNLVRACDYAPFRSPWGHARTVLDGSEVGILKASLLGEPTHERPGTVGEPRGNLVRVACGDAWVGVSRVLAHGSHRDAIEVLRPGMRVEATANGSTGAARSAPGRPAHAASGADPAADRREDVTRRVIQLFAEQLDLEVPSPGTDLLEGGLLDSLKFVELLLQLEQRFDTRVDLDAFEPDNFRTIDRIAAFVIQHGGRSTDR